MLDFLIVLFGCLLFFSGLKRISHEKYMPRLGVQRLALLLSMFILWGAFVYSPHFAEIIVLGMLISVFGFYKMAQYYFTLEFPRAVKEFYEEVILIMSSGRSFHDAAKTVLAEPRGFVALKLKEIFEASVTGGGLSQALSANRNSTFIMGQFSQQVKTLYFSQGRVLDRAKIFRRQLRLEERLKQKSKQATLQVTVQAGVLSALYFLLLSYLFVKGSLFHITVLISIGLYLVGLLLMLVLSRRPKWKL